MGLLAKIDENEVAELRRRLVSLPQEGQARVLEGVLTPGLRLRILREEIRRDIVARRMTLRKRRWNARSTRGRARGPSS